MAMEPSPGGGMAFYVATVPAESGGGDRDLCVIAHRFGYALIYGAAAHPSGDPGGDLVQDRVW